MNRPVLSFPGRCRHGWARVSALVAMFSALVAVCAAGDEPDGWTAVAVVAGFLAMVFGLLGADDPRMGERS